VHAVERFGHDARFPVTSNWPHLRDELVGFIEGRVPARALLVGHSLGGMLSLLAAHRLPVRAAGVVLLDSPVIAGWRAHGLQAAKATGLIRRITPGRIARMRRTDWPDRAAVLEHLRRKHVFARWDARVLEAYVDAGFEHGADAHSRLAFDRETEARIYETLPHHIGRLLARQPLACPVGFIGGRRSAELRQAGLEATRRLVGTRFEWTDGSHLFPMEQPERTAALVLRMIETLHG
jgi:pimeloyl-ACP methyl ester carboxylesterase